MLAFFVRDLCQYSGDQGNLMTYMTLLLNLFSLLLILILSKLGSRKLSIQCMQGLVHYKHRCCGNVADIWQVGGGFPFLFHSLTFSGSLPKYFDLSIDGLYQRTCARRLFLVDHHYFESEQEFHLSTARHRKRLLIHAQLILQQS